MSVLFPLLEESWNGQPERSVDQKIPPDRHCSPNGSMRWTAPLVQICSRLLTLNAELNGWLKHAALAQNAMKSGSLINE